MEGGLILITRIRLTILLLGLALLITGCVNGEFKVKVNKDGSADLDYKLLMNASLLAFAEPGKNPLDEMKQDAEKDGFTVSNVSEGEMVGIKATKHVEKINEIPMFGDKKLSDKFYIEKGWFQDTYRLKTNMDLSDMKETGEGAEMANAMLSQIKLKFILALPVKAEKHNASSVSDEGKTLEWHLVPGQNNNIEFEAKVLNTTNIAITAGGVILLLGIITFIVKKKKHDVVPTE